MSLVGVYDSEWRKRKINLFSVIRSFVSQLSPGQELTKVSLPSELCHPFSMLELVAYRELQLLHILFDVLDYTDPHDRFLAIVKWYLGLVREETMEKKPFNPVIGETHLCWVDHGDDDFTEFIGEQVSHHPPVSAFIVRNKKRDLSITGAVTFKVAFGSNCASVTTGGEVTIHTAKESYTMTKCVPDMMVNNVIWGDKYLMWEGAVTITCSDNDYVAKLKLSEVENRNIIEGEIYQEQNVIHKLSGVAGSTTFISDIDNKEQNMEEGEIEEERDKRLFVDISIYKENTIVYLPVEVQTAFNSLKLWNPVKEAIIKNDLVVADEEKKKIEADQRIRQRHRIEYGAWKDSQYFSFQSREQNDEEREAQLEKGTWEFKNNFTIDQEYITTMFQEAEQIRAKQEPTTVDAVDEPNTEEPPHDSQSCNIQ